MKLKDLMKVGFRGSESVDTRPILKRAKGEVTTEMQGIILTGKPEDIKATLQTFQTMGENAEAEEVRELGVKLMKENTKLVNEVMELRKDKAALIAFIEANVTDEEKLKQIFGGK